MPDRDRSASTNNQLILSGRTFEEYNETDFMNKATIDSYFFKNLLYNFPEENLEDAVEMISQLYDNIHDIYEYINVKPGTYEFNLQTALNNSEEELERQAKDYIDKYFDEIYSILPEEQEKFFPKIESTAGRLITENQLNEDEAVEFAAKIVLMENLVNQICFPADVQSYIEARLGDILFSDASETEALQYRWDVFKDQVYNISRIAAAIYV